jgi:sulfite reductase alpha subunit-like flavoprotein
LFFETTEKTSVEIMVGTIGSKKILVLYGSQTGNSEQAALDFVKAVGEANASALQLDDFLELHKALFIDGVLVIIVSSYGVGGAPLGAQRFRQVCDYWLEQSYDEQDRPLDGLRYAMCGLGDSKFTSFFENPTRIDKALRHVGARRIGNLGQADASGDQEAAILQWRNSVLQQVQAGAAQCTVTDERLQKMQEFTMASFAKVLPPLQASGREKIVNRETVMVFLSACLVALIAFFFVFRS